MSDAKDDELVKEWQEEYFRVSRLQRDQIQALTAEVERLKSTNHLEIVLPPFGHAFTLPTEQLDMEALAWLRENAVIVTKKYHDALAAQLAGAEALLREWADSGVEYKSSKYRLTQIDHRTYLETVNFLAAGSAPAGDIPLRERLDPDGPGEGGRMKFSASVQRVGCERSDGTLNIHAESETCEVCGTDQPSGEGE